MSDLFSIKNKVALVTGGSRGIGLMIARGYVEAGARVYVSSRKKETCDQVAAELSRIGTCMSAPADCSTQAGCEALAAAVAARESRLDILVNNAGANWGAPLAEYPDTAWDKVLALNVKAIFHLTRACLPMLRAAATAADPARVINIGSIDGLHVPLLETYAYSSSKAAVHHLTRVLAMRFAPDHITVNAVAPGAVLPPDDWPVAARDRLAATTPLRRLGSPDDVVRAVVFLLENDYLTGVVLPVDGGRLVR